MMSFKSSPNCGLRKRKNESSSANDNDSHAFVSELSNGTASFLFNNKMRNMNVDETFFPPRQLEFITKSIKSPNEHKTSAI